MLLEHMEAEVRQLREVITTMREVAAGMKEQLRRHESDIRAFAPAVQQIHDFKVGLASLEREVVKLDADVEKLRGDVNAALEKEREERKRGQDERIRESQAQKEERDLEILKITTQIKTANRALYGTFLTSFLALVSVVVPILLGVNPP